MNLCATIAVSTALICLFAVSLTAKENPGENSGEALFKEHCASCHPDGGNILNPRKTPTEYLVGQSCLNVQFFELN